MRSNSYHHIRKVVARTALHRVRCGARQRKAEPKNSPHSSAGLVQGFQIHYAAWPWVVLQEDARLSQAGETLPADEIDDPPGSPLVVSPVPDGCRTVLSGGSQPVAAAVQVSLGSLLARAPVAELLHLNVLDD
jgi:hypothetical protein